MVFWRFTFRELASRPGRAILTLLSIVISVAAAVAVNLSTATTHRAYQQMYESLTGRAALEVVAEGGGVYDEEIVPELEQVPGVAAVVPLMQQPSVLYVGDNRVRLLVMGIDPERDEAVRDYELVAGTFFEEDYGALMEIGFARSLGIGVGDEVRLLTHWGPRRVAVLGLLAPRGAA
jgi:putative ABC transport system permease protein